MGEILSPASGVDLAPLTTLGVGGRARWFASARTSEHVRAAHLWAYERGVELMVLGGGSNLVVADRGIDALVVQMEVRGVAERSSGEDTLLQAGAGEPWDGVVARACALRLAGVECLSGIPGSTGGTPIQNVGAYGQDVGEVVETVSVFDRTTGELTTLSAAECRFGYRMSRFKSDETGRFVVCELTMRLRPGAPRVTYPDLSAELSRTGLASPTVADVRQAVLAVRRRKGMVLDSADADTRSVGSFFTNPVVSVAVHERIGSEAGTGAPAFPAGAGRVKIPAAWLIEQAGFRRGHLDGPVGISTKHTLAIVNRGGAMARDVVRLAATIKRRVSDRFGVSLRPEPILVGFQADPDAEYLQS